MNAEQLRAEVADDRARELLDGRTPLDGPAPHDAPGHRQDLQRRTYTLSENDSRYTLPFPQSAVNEQSRTERLNRERSGDLRGPHEKTVRFLHRTVFFIILHAMRAIIIEDEPLSVAELRTTLAEVAPQIEVVATASSVAEAAETVSPASITT